MWFATFSCAACALAVYLARRAERRVPAAAPLERTLQKLRHGAELAQESWVDTEPVVRELLVSFAAARSAGAAIAALNEFITEAETVSAHGAEVPKTLARVCFSVGILGGVLALARGLGGGLPSPELAGDALGSVAVGLLGGMLCHYVGQKASARRRRYRDCVRELSRWFRQRVEETWPAA
jgi:hypothetical protein